jgi:hypothetical protein
MIKVIATFFICRMIEGLDVMEITDLPTHCCSLTNKAVFSTDIYGNIFHSFNVVQFLLQSRLRITV